MPVHSARTAAATLALAVLAACGGSSSPPPPGPLELACSVSLSGPNPILTVVGRARSTATTGAPITVTLALSPAPQTFTLSAPGWTGSAELRGAAVRAGGTVSGQATVDGVAAAASCVASGGLPVLTAHADRTATGADIGWNAVAGAVVYRWSLRDGPTGAVVTSGSTTGTSAQATATLDPLQGYLVEVGGYALTGAETTYPTPLPSPQASFARTAFTSGSTGGDGITAWQLFGPGDFIGGTLTVRYPALAAGERLAVLLVNAGGDDGVAASVTASGTGNPSLSLAAPAPLLAMAGGSGATATGTGVRIDRSGVMAGEAMVSARREETIARLRDGRLPRAAPGRPADGRLLATAVAAALPATRSFCQGQYSGTGTFTQVWKPASLKHETAHAAFYATDEVQPGIDRALASRPDFFSSLGDAYETRILAALTTYFGPESDVDANGKMIFLFGNLGKSGSSFPVGYFWPGDIELPLASASTCRLNSVGNRADMLYLIDPGNFTANWDPSGANYDVVLDLILDGEYPSTMAHELQHDVNYNTRCPPGAACGVDEELWLNEGLSMLSETVAGYGLHTATSRANVRTYQGPDTTTGLPLYQGYGMTVWEGDPWGNYAGVQAYMQYLLDHATPAMTKALENKWLAGKANIEAATGEAWEVGFARFATAAMFSNEDASAYPGGVVTTFGDLLADPLFNYLGDGVSTPQPYVPWHHYTGSCAASGTSYPKARTAYVDFTPLFPGATATLRRDGWAAFATGPGSGVTATITVQSTATLRPHVVVVKYAGRLPDYGFDSSCP